MFLNPREILGKTMILYYWTDSSLYIIITVYNYIIKLIFSLLYIFGQTSVHIISIIIVGNNIYV